MAMKRKRYRVVSKSVVAPAKAARMGVGGPSKIMGTVSRSVTQIGKWMK